LKNEIFIVDIDGKLQNYKKSKLALVFLRKWGPIFAPEEFTRQFNSAL